MPKHIDEKELINRTDGGLLIFKYYFPNYNFDSSSSTIKSTTEDNDTASILINESNNLWTITDYKNLPDINKTDPISFVRLKEQLDYYSALLFIKHNILHDFGTTTKFTAPILEANYSTRDTFPSDNAGDYNFIFKDNPSNKDIESLGSYITSSTLDYFKCKAIKSYEFISKDKDGHLICHIYGSTDSYPIFLFDYGDFKKLYKPHEQDKKYRFSHIGKEPNNYIYNLENIRVLKDEFSKEDKRPSEKPEAFIKDLYRCSDEIEAMNMYSLGFNVYWLNSDNAYCNGRFKEIDDMCDNHFQTIGHNTTNKHSISKLALKYINLKTIKLPNLSSNRDFTGNPCMDLKDLICISRNADTAKYKIKVLSSNAVSCKFWSYDNNKKNLTFSYSDLKFLYEMFGYKTCIVQEFKGSIGYSLTQGNYISIISPNNINRHMIISLHTWLESLPILEEKEVSNKLLASPSKINKNLIDNDYDVNNNFFYGNEFEEYIHFKNASIKITPNNIDLINRTHFDYPILKDAKTRGDKISQIIDKNIGMKPIQMPFEINYSDIYNKYSQLIETCEDPNKLKELKSKMDAIDDIDKYALTFNSNTFFTDFVKDLSNHYWRKEENNKPLTELEIKKNNLLFCSIMFSLGYLCAQYKNPNKPWVVFIRDCNNTRSGRSGKSLLSRAVSYIRNSFYISGGNLDKYKNFQFIYDGLTEYHDIIEIDYLNEKAKFEKFEDEITGSRIVKSKGIKEFNLPYNKSSKMLFSSIFELPKMNSSSLEHIINIEISDYYHEVTGLTNKNLFRNSVNPNTKYGKNLYEDFSNIEWDTFYWMMAYCIQLQMRFNKISVPKNKRTKDIKEIKAFKEWADKYFIECANHTLPEFSGGNNTTLNQQAYFNTKIHKNTMIENYRANYDKSNITTRKLTNTTFKKELNSWCQQNGYTVNPQFTINDKTRKRIRVKNSETGKLEEYIYIFNPNLQF